MDINNVKGTATPTEQGTTLTATALRPLEVIRDEITTYQEQGERAFMEVGRLLLEAKARFAEQGKWLAWLKDNTSFIPRKAQRLMRVASYFSDAATPVSQLGVSKVYVLCRLPPKDVESFLKNLHHVGGSRPKSVEEMTRRELEQAVCQHLEKIKRERTGQLPTAPARESSAVSAQSVQARIDRLRKELSALSQLVTDSKGASALNDTMTAEVCKLCEDIMRQLAPDLVDELLA